MSYANQLAPTDDDLRAALAAIRKVNPEARPTPEELADLALARQGSRLARFLNGTEGDRIADLIELHVWSEEHNRLAEQLTVAWLTPLDHSREDFERTVKVIARRARDAAYTIISARRLA